MSLNETLLRVSEVIGSPLRLEWKTATGLWRASVDAVIIHRAQSDQGISAETPELAVKGYVTELQRSLLDQAVSIIAQADQLQKRAADLDDVLRELQ